MVGPDEAARMLRVVTARPAQLDLGRPTVEVDETRDGWRVTVRVDGRLEARRRFADEVPALVWAGEQELDGEVCE
jgi:hypothetical protein